MKNWQNPEIKSLDVQETYGGPIYNEVVDYDFYDGMWVEYLGETES